MPGTFNESSGVCPGPAADGRPWFSPGAARQGCLAREVAAMSQVAAARERAWQAVVD